MNATFAAEGKPAPSFLRSSVTRQQMQIYIGIGIGGLAASLMAVHTAILSTDLGLVSRSWFRL